MAFCIINLGSFRSALELSLHSVVFTLSLLFEATVPNLIPSILFCCIGLLKAGIAMREDGILSHYRWDNHGAEHDSAYHVSNDSDHFFRLPNKLGKKSPTARAA